MEGWAPAAYLEKFGGNPSTKQGVSISGSEHPFPLSKQRGENNKDIVQDALGRRDQYSGGQGGRSASIPMGRIRSSSTHRGSSCSTTSLGHGGRGNGQKLSQSTEDILSTLR